MTHHLHDLPCSPSVRRRLPLLAPLALLLLLLILKVVYACTLRIDSDETQHLHVVWGWAHGLLPYRDLFDNHSPLFQFLYTPLFSILGERADIVIPMRLAVIPLFIACLWITYRLGTTLFSREVGLWAAVAAGALPPFFIKSSEFRTDDLWAMFWLLTIWLLLRRPFTSSRSFVSGLALGAAFATSMKTTPLLLGLLIALVMVMTGKARRRENVNWKSLIRSAGLGLLGATLLPACIVGFFAAKGALPNLYYCTIQHNIAPDTWSRVLKQMRWFAPLLFGTSVAGWIVWRTATETWKRDRIAIIVLSLLGYFILLAKFWWIVQTQDFLPVIPLVALLGTAAIANRPIRRYGSIIFPGFAIAEILILVGFSLPRSNAMSNKQAMIATVLTLTNKDDFVMDAKGETVFRRRPFYYVLEELTKRRMELGLIKDDIPERLIATRTPVATLVRMPPRAHDFIEHNYLPIAFRTLVLGKMLGSKQKIFPKTYEFDVAIPGRYVVLSENGHFQGTLDGIPLEGARMLQAGHHQLQVDGGGGRLALIWARAPEKGFSPFSAIPEDRLGPED
jgi:Dolichyl-phosphate-mannose-protein mannosyltransferase